jgi:ketosteroid isomerase-like protein
MEGNGKAMKQIVRLFISSALIMNVLLPFGYSESGSSAPTQVSKEKKSVQTGATEQLLQDFIESLNTCDLEKLMPLFSDDATVFFPIANAPLRADGSEKIEGIFREFFNQARAGKAGPLYMNLQAEDVKTQILDKTAVVTFHIRSGAVTSRRTLILRYSNNKWSIVHLHASNMRKGET